MPGDNCADFGCGTRRRLKGIGTWNLLVEKDEGHQKWREDWLREITKTREIDKDFRVFTSEKHFLPEDIERYKLLSFYY